MSSSKSTVDRFELIDSSSHPLKSFKVTIKYMKLYIEPDFSSNAIHCVQDIKLQSNEELRAPIVELDAADLTIKKINYRASINTEPVEEIPFIYDNEKLVIQLPEQVKKGSYFFLHIEYWGKTRRGFRFVGPDNYHPEKEVQAWTQGQIIESKFWFPCIDDPQIKYPRDISVLVPHEFVVVSNGRLEEVSTQQQKKAYLWKEDSPQSSYLKSIVIGKFAEIVERYERDIELLYYVPVEKRDRAGRSFNGTSDMIKFFESYLKTPYPYSKYAQTAVQDFEYGGMENTSCTTLPDNVLLDEKAALDDFPSTWS